MPDGEPMPRGAARRTGAGLGAASTSTDLTDLTDLTGELVAAYEAGLTVAEIAGIYRVDHDEVAQLMVTTGARRPPRSRLLRLVTPSGRAARRVARNR